MSAACWYSFSKVDLDRGLRAYQHLQRLQGQQRFKAGAAVIQAFEEGDDLRVKVRVGGEKGAGATAGLFSIRVPMILCVNGEKGLVKR